VRRSCPHSETPFPAIKALRDVTLVQLEGHRSDLSDLIFRRCHHVISENERVLATVRRSGKAHWGRRPLHGKLAPQLAR